MYKNFKFAGQLTETAFDGVLVQYDGKNATIGYSTKPQRARCLFLLSMELEKGDRPFEIKETPRFETIGPMLDVSRGKVLTVAGVKRYIDAITALGMNMLMLYTEDVYEVEGYPQFGYLRGRYALAELRELDAYAAEQGVEMIPCIQTFGHMEQYIKNPEGKKIANDRKNLMAGNEDTYRFIEAEIATMRKAFKTQRIHLGMDETFNAHLGNYLKAYGLEEETKVYREHLKRVLEISGKYFKEPMIWSDMIHDTPDGKPYSDEQTPSPEQIAQTPKNVELVFWDYYKKTKEWYSTILSHHELFQNKLAFGGGIWTWDGLMPNLDYTVKTMQPAMEACLEHQVKTVIITLWVSGQNGADYGQAMAGLPIFSEYCYKGEACTMADIYAASKHLTGVDEALFHAISDIYLNQPRSAVSLAKGFIYGHPLQNLMLYDIDYPAAIEIFQKALKTIEAHTDYEHREFFSILYRIAIAKATLYNGLQAAYKKGDRAFLEKAAREILPQIEADFDAFYPLFKELWLRDYKAFGLDYYLADLGGARLQAQYARETLEDYLAGKIDQIEELEPEILSGLNVRNRGVAGYMSKFR